MKCAIGCRNNAIGIANLKGRKGTSLEGTGGAYALCLRHHDALVNPEENWGDMVELLGWESFVPLESIARVH